MSGANKDGALGLKQIKSAGGLAIVQDPKECQVKTMPTAAMAVTDVDHIYNTDKIIKFLKQL